MSPSLSPTAVATNPATTDVTAVLRSVLALPAPLERYERMLTLADEDLDTFFRVAQANLSRCLPMIYTPTVGEACVHYPDLAVPRRGLWLTPSKHAGKIADTLRGLGLSAGVDAIVVSDCQRILGLGDLGANGMPIPVGKLLLYSACGGINPSRTLPVVLDVGCNTDSVVSHPGYMGVKQPRITGEQYDSFVHEFMTAARDVFGPHCLIQFEDFGNANAARLLRKYRDDFLSFNDDIQGTASVGLAGILSALRIPGVPSALTDHSFVFLGAGSAGIGIADLIVLALTRKGLSEAEARAKCWFIDSKGLVYSGRSGQISEEKQRYAHELPAGSAVSALMASGQKAELADIVTALKPTGLIGVSTQPGVFDKKVFDAMCAANERPIVFALSNPTRKSECSAQQAYEFSDGKAVFASGSPFDAVTLPDGRHFVPGQGNNCFIFPGLGFGALVAKASKVPDAMILTAAETLATLVPQHRLDVGCVYPDIDLLLDISAHIASAVAKEAVALGVSTLGEDEQKRLSVESLRRRMYEPARQQF